MSSNENVIDFDAHRKRQERIGLVLPRQMANSGSKPFLGLASDGDTYWCKRFESPHGPEAVINEVVASITGETIGAQIRPWRIIHVPQSLSDTLITSDHNPTDRYRIGKLPLFGSLNLHTSDVCTSPAVIPHVTDDANINHIPKILALWDLCCVHDDHQLLIDYDADNQLWSIDHGFWFDSFEQPWAYGPPEAKGATPDLPKLRAYIPQKCWDKASAAVDALDKNLFATIFDQLPPEWDVDENEVSNLVDYILARKPFTLSKLEQFRKTNGRK